jgi:hypothetical protein
VRAFLGFAVGQHCLRHQGGPRARAGDDEPLAAAFHKARRETASAQAVRHELLFSARKEDASRMIQLVACSRIDVRIPWVNGSERDIRHADPLESVAILFSNLCAVARRIHNDEDSGLVTSGKIGEAAEDLGIPDFVFMPTDQHDRSRRDGRSRFVPIRPLSTLLAVLRPTHERSDQRGA